MALKKDKQKVLDEVLDETRIRSFLEINPPEGVNADFNILEKAYRGMPVEYFDTFLELFVKDNRDINATNPGGKSLSQIVAQHDECKPYLELLTKHGAVL